MRNFKKIDFFLTFSLFGSTVTPAGQLPVMEIDGIQIIQSLSIARFLANKFNLAGATVIEKAQADMVVECTKDFYDCKLANQL